MFSGQMSFLSCWEKNHLLVLLLCDQAILFLQRLLFTYLMSYNPKICSGYGFLRLKKHLVCFKE